LRRAAFFFAISRLIFCFTADARQARGAHPRSGVTSRFATPKDATMLIFTSRRAIMRRKDAKCHATPRSKMPLRDIRHSRQPEQSERRVRFTAQ